MSEPPLLAVRGRDGQIAHYPLVENEHRDGILHRSLAPASDTGEELSERAAEYASRILSELEYVGVLAIGRTSWTLGELAMQADRPCAYCRATVVATDGERPTPLPQDLRDWLGKSAVAGVAV